MESAIQALEEAAARAKSVELDATLPPSASPAFNAKTPQGVKSAAASPADEDADSEGDEEEEGEEEGSSGVWKALVGGMALLAVAGVAAFLFKSSGKKISRK